MFNIGDVVKVCEHPRNTRYVGWNEVMMGRFRNQVGIVWDIVTEPSELCPNGVYHLEFDDVKNTYFFDGAWLEPVCAIEPTDTKALDAFFEEF